MFLSLNCLYVSKKREREGEDEGKKEGGEVLKTGEGKRKCLTTKHRYPSLYMNFNLLIFRLCKMGRSTLPRKWKITQVLSKSIKKTLCLKET